MINELNLQIRKLFGEKDFINSSDVIKVLDRYFDDKVIVRLKNVSRKEM